MEEIQELVKKVAPTNTTVLLSGESGTGRTLVARIIHEVSGRARFPFVKVNSADLPDNLLESELFGCEKGAFTGATESRSGRVAEADGGTIFLDEIGELSMSLQVKLLRFIQDKEFERLGSTKTRKVDVRIISATNKNLAAAVSEGMFREDLYYRLNVFPIRVPSVRERPEDVISLINFFSDKVSREYGYQLHFTVAALDILTRYSWPGRVREMENLIERLAIIFGEVKIDIEDLSPNAARAISEQEPGEMRPLDLLQERERRDVLDALQRNHWVQSRAARQLGITLRQMGYRVRKFGLERLVKQKSAY